MVPKVSGASSSCPQATFPKPGNSGPHGPTEAEAFFSPSPPAPTSEQPRLTAPSQTLNCDFQAKGAQTVLPPSRHRNGGLYAWKDSSGTLGTKTGSGT